jgi:hypothetical protein
MKLPTLKTLLTLMIVGLAAPCFAQGPAMSRGTQNLRTGYDDCLRRAESALNAEGYRIDDRSDAWRGGTKSGIRAEIVCSPGGSGTWANTIVVGSGGTPFGNPLENERSRLQQRLDSGNSGNSDRPSPPVTSTSSNLTGSWTWIATCQNSTPSGRFQITNQRQSSFSGAFSNANPVDTGTIDGRQQGILVEFRRNIPGVGEQQWSGGVERDGRGLRMEGRIDGPGGPCTFSATTNTGAPRGPGASVNVAGTWNWTAECNGSRPSGRFEIVTQRRDGTVSGVFSNANAADTGTIDGRQQGLLIDFRRAIPGAGEQRWTGGLSGSGGTLLMEGRIDGVGGPCNFSASLGR